MTIELNEDYAARVYAGVLGKLIGVYLGRPVEGWPYDEIRSRFGVVDHYVNDDLGIPLIVADDDISGTLAFGRSVEDARGADITPALVGETWLNYIIEDRTILWWGGYGRSTEHTAFLNLKRGVPAPQSGSIAHNGSTLAEQIGAQIFSDAFAMMVPGDPDQAVAMTAAAASVSHDGVAVESAGFLAAMRAAAFEERGLDRLIELGRGYVTDARLLRIIDSVVERVGATDDWREVRDWVDHHYGYAVYPGPCHALSNIAMSLAALRLGGDDFRTVVAVASSVGFDTDSNAGTVGALTGIRLGLDAFAAVPDLRTPVADRAIVVSADGGESVTDAAREARRIVDAARTQRGMPPMPRRARFDFSLPGAVHGFESCPYLPDAVVTEAVNRNYSTGPAALELRVGAGEQAAVSAPVFLDPRDAMSNFSTLASPTLYPTDTITATVSAGASMRVFLFAVYQDGDTVHIERGPLSSVDAGETRLDWEIPVAGALIPFRVGVAAIAEPGAGSTLLLHGMDWSGAPRRFQQEGILLDSIWDTKPQALAPWVSSARNFEADFATTYSVSHPERGGVATIGSREWVDYSVRSTLVFSLHDGAGLVVRARGHRSFAGAVFAAGEVRLVDQNGPERRTLASRSFPARLDRRYDVELRCFGPHLALLVDGELLLTAETPRTLGGGGGFLIDSGTMSADGLTVERIASL